MIIIGVNMRAKSFFLAIAAAMMLSGMACAQATLTGALSFANVSVSPNPVVAGGNAVIKFQLYNSFNFWIYNVNLQPEGSYPLLNVSPINSKVVGVLNPGLNGNYLNYTIAVPATTPSGVYTLTFVATYYAYASSGVIVSSSSMPVSFYVQNKPTVVVKAASSQPASLYTGYNQTVNLVIENIGYGNARNVSVTVAGQHGLNLLSSVTSFFIPNLTQGSSVTEPVLVSSNNAGQASLLANITYYSSSLNQRFYSTGTVNLS